MGNVWASMHRPIRIALPYALVVLLVLSLAGIQPVRAQTEDAGDIIVSIALAGALVGVLVYFSERGKEMARQEIIERGCPVPDRLMPSSLDDCIRRTEYLNAHPGTDPRVAEMILHGRFAMGMTAAEVEASIGPPTTINRSVTAYGATEQWVYRTPGGYSANYLYLDDGILRSWQVSR